MEKGEGTEYLGHKAVGFERGKWSVAAEELVKIATWAVWHDQAKLGTFILKEIGNWEDIGMCGVQVGEMDGGAA